MTIRTDQRSLPAARQPEAHARLVAARAALRESQVQLAKDFALVDRTNHFVYEGCASVVEYGMKLGYDANEVRMYTNLGKVFEAEPTAEAKFRGGTLSVEAGAAVGRIYANPLLRRPGDRWLEHAQTDGLRALRRRVRERVEQQAQAETGLEEVHVVVTARTRDRFDRARQVASQRAGKALTAGQTFSRVVEFYLEKHDPLSTPGAARRVPHTSLRPGSRYIPAEVKRAVRARSGGVCEVQGCEHRLGLEFAHRVPHAEGSAREVEDLGELCHRHHVLYDAGTIPWPVVQPGGRGPPRGGGGPPGARHAGDVRVDDGSSTPDRPGRDPPPGRVAESTPHLRASRGAPRRRMRPHGQRHRLHLRH